MIKHLLRLVMLLIPIVIVWSSGNKSEIGFMFIGVAYLILIIYNQWRMIDAAEEARDSKA